MYIFTTIIYIYYNWVNFHFIFESNRFNKREPETILNEACVGCHSNVYNYYKIIIIILMMVEAIIFKMMMMMIMTVVVEGGDLIHFIYRKICWKDNADVAAPVAGAVYN